MKTGNNMEAESICKICGNHVHNRCFIATERLLGLNDQFEYFECSNCKCLQIKEIPPNMDRYYPDHYYSYQQPVFATKLTGLRYFMKKSLAAHYSGRFNFAGLLLSMYYDNPFSWLRPNMANFNSKILDVGCGKGRLLLSMQRSGFKNLTGIDPYNKEDIFYGNKLAVYKKEIFDVNERYDLIMLHHSFEHMESPKSVLMRLHELINVQGYIVIRIPVANSYAWRKYHNHWAHLDAPRHFFLHTIKSINILANECGLKLHDVEFESGSRQFTGSEKYLRGIGFNENNTIFSKKQIKMFEREAKRLNHLNDGDSACFYFQKLR